MADYYYSASCDAVALTAARKTVLQIATPSVGQISIVSMDITFDGVTASNAPVLVTLEQQATAGTGGVALTANWGPNPFDPIFPATSCTALKGPWATAEPALTKVYKAWRVSPTSGLCYQWPLDQEPVCPASGFIGVVVLAGASVNATCSIVWKQ